MSDIYNNNLNDKNLESIDSGSSIFNDKNIAGQPVANNSPAMGSKALKTADVDKKRSDEPAVKDAAKKKRKMPSSLLTHAAANPVWLSVSEAAKIGGVQNKTIRRAIQSKTLKYKVASNRYLVDFSSLIIFLHSKTKLKNKLNEFGIGQYINEWAE